MSSVLIKLAFTWKCCDASMVNFFDFISIFLRDQPINYDLDR